MWQAKRSINDDANEYPKTPTATSHFLDAMRVTLWMVLSLVATGLFQLILLHSVKY
jgi:hypothetical protein